MKKSLFILFILFSCKALICQNISFPDDARERGYFNRAYLRYEAEPEKCKSTGLILTPTYDQREIQCEASNQTAISLIDKNSYIEWINTSDADGLTLRFSIPDDNQGLGTQGNLALYVNNKFIQNIKIDSYWAWQYILKNGTKYPDNIPDPTNKFPRMRFDEIHIKLTDKIPANSSFRLEKVDDNLIPYTIDFVELEKVPAEVTFDSISDSNKIMYLPSLGSLYSFIAANRGKTIYIPSGKYEIDKKITINSGDNTKIIGAGMWYTEIYFNSSSDDKSTYNQRGIEMYGNNIVLQGLYLNTINNKRYYQNNDAYQVGKGLMGSFGSNSQIRDLWIEHFECGAWIENSNFLTVENCRFRNNYADGFNYSYASKNSVVEHSSFRNNGDDDMATWSRSDGLCENNTFRYCTSENNWRASGLGLFGGKQNKAYNCVIIDAMEAGFRVTSDFPGMPFSNDGYSEIYNISVYKGGVANGTAGISGDLWGNQQGALHINSSSQYDLQNIKIYDIDLYNSKNNGIFIGSGSKYIKNLILKNINIFQTGNYGLFFSNTKGNATYCNINYQNIGGASNYNSIPTAFSFIENCSTAVKQTENNLFNAVPSKGKLQISGVKNTSLSIFNILGKSIYNSRFTSDEIQLDNLVSGVYLVKWDNYNLYQKVIVP